MERYAIGLDLGTSSAKGVLFSERGEIVAKETADFIYKDAALPDGAAYHGMDMSLFYRTICQVTAALSGQMPQGGMLAGLAMASASGNTVLCDGEGNALIDGYSWVNRDMKEETVAVFGEIDEAAVREAAGWGIAYSFPLGQLSHLRLHAPALLDRAATVCMSTEYVLHRLTGKWGIDRSTATPSYFYDQKKDAWNKEYLDTLGIPAEKLPPLMACGDLLGEVSEQGAAEAGLPVGTRVFVGSFDHPTAARACGIEQEGDLLISCGTSWVCFLPMNARARIIEGKMLCDPFLTPAGAWGAMRSLARASERIKAIVERYISDKEDKFRVLDECAARSRFGAGGLTLNPMQDTLPALDGYPRDDIARALMEGIARELKQRIDGVVTVRRAVMCGGPSASPVWRQVLSEVLGVPVTVTYGAHSGAVGAAMYALR